MIDAYIGRYIWPLKSTQAKVDRGRYGDQRAEGLRWMRCDAELRLGADDYSCQYNLQHVSNCDKRHWILTHSSQLSQRHWLMCSSNTVRSPHRIENIHNKMIAFEIVKMLLINLRVVALMPASLVLLYPRRIRIPPTESHCLMATGMESPTRLRIFEDWERCWLYEGSEDAPLLRG
jgi:hypothetical protein